MMFPTVKSMDTANIYFARIYEAYEIINFIRRICPTNETRSLVHQKKLQLLTAERRLQDIVWW